MRMWMRGLLWPAVALLWAGGVLAETVQAPQPLKVENVLSLAPGDELVLNAERRKFERGDFVALVDVKPGPHVRYARVLERLGKAEVKLRIVEPEY